MTQMGAGQPGIPTPPTGAAGPAAGPPTFSFKPSEEPWAGETKPDDRTMGLLCHLLEFFWVIGPLIIWLIKKDESKYVDVNGKEALNFGLSILIYGVVLGAVSCGFLFPLPWLFNIIMIIIAAMKANQMIVYRYPLAIRFIK